MIRKAFLDKIYARKADVMSEIHRLHTKSNLPVAKCCDDMEYKSEDKVRLNSRRKELLNINLIIQDYLDIHDNNNI